MYGSIVESLLASTEPAIRWKVRSRVLGEPTESPQMTALREEIRGSATVRRLLAPLGAADPPAVYAKWQGAHWVLGALAELGYPPGDQALHPLREQVLNTWLHEAYHRDVELATKSAVYRLGCAGHAWPAPRARLTAGKRAVVSADSGRGRCAL